MQLQECKSIVDKTLPAAGCLLHGSGVQLRKYFDTKTILYEEFTHPLSRNAYRSM